MSKDRSLSHGKQSRFRGGCPQHQPCVLSMSRLRSTSPSESSPAARRLSWTPSVQDLDDVRAPRRLSSSRPIPDENFAPGWSGGLHNFSKGRRPSFAPSLPESFRQARKPRFEAAEENPGPEIVKPVDTGGLPESPEEGKSMRSSLEINVKDLVGDAVGNVCYSTITVVAVEERA